MTLLGDAAHTHGGAFAAGAGLAIDDAYALGRAFDVVFPPSSTLVGKVSPAQIHRVFDLYESTRKPHTDKVLAIVHDNRAKSAARFKEKFSGHPESDEEFRKRLTSRGDPVWLNEHDVEAAFQKVLAEKSHTIAATPVAEKSRL